jgi:hypothetical protein
VALDELRGGAGGVRRDLRLVGRQREIGVLEPRREVEERSSGVPRDRGQQLVAAAQLGERLVLAVDEQQSAARELPNAARVLSLEPPALRDPEEQAQVVRLERARLACQCGRNERRVTLAVDEEERCSARVRQR